jgi:hypothetical protein
LAYTDARPSFADEVAEMGLTAHVAETQAVFAPIAH